MARARTTPPRAEPESSEQSEYDAFEQLTKKLLTVPKKDLDEARAREQAEGA